MLTSAPGNGAPIGGLKVVTESGWFAAGPPAPKTFYKLYAESFKGQEHLAEIQDGGQGHPRPSALATARRAALPLARCITTGVSIATSASE